MSSSRPQPASFVTSERTMGCTATGTDHTFATTKSATGPERAMAFLADTMHSTT